MARIEAARVELDLQLQRESVAVERDKVRLEGDKLALEREEIAVKRARVEHASVLELERERNAVALNLIGVHNQHVLPLPNHLTSVYATVSAAWRGWPKKTPALWLCAARHRSVSRTHSARVARVQSALKKCSIAIATGFGSELATVRATHTRGSRVVSERAGDSSETQSPAGRLDCKECTAHFCALKPARKRSRSVRTETAKRAGARPSSDSNYGVRHSTALNRDADRTEAGGRGLSVCWRSRDE